MSWSTTLKNRQRLRAALESGEGIAVMFSDIRGFSSYTAREGDRAAFQLSRLHQRLLEEAIQESEGVLVKSLGDGVMAAFPDPSNGLAGAARIQRSIAARNRTSDEAPIDVGIGLAAGTPIMTENDLIGHSVNLSQRISALAKGGQILVSSSVQQAATLSEDLRYIPLGTRALKGLGSEEIFEVAWMAERARLTDGGDLVTLVLTDRSTLVLEISKELQPGAEPVEDGNRLSRALSKWIYRGTKALVRTSLAAFGVGREHPIDRVRLSLDGRDVVVDIDGHGLRLGNVDREEAQRFFDQMTIAQEQSQ
ncbi:MAG: adenylate/guanylate cyclase domain-containing protein [Candidatus Bipolaricaulota bacterium]|nr:MAG: adenylate/guanylate cyclase domain-containing protein [Candidatus Bipolaricaulota bacterium]